MSARAESRWISLLSAISVALAACVAAAASSSPSGPRITWIGFDRMYVVDPHGRSVRHIPWPQDQYLWEYGNPAWSRLGKALAYNACVSATCLIVVYRPRLATHTELDQGRVGYATHPTWDPSGTRIAFAVGESADTGIAISIVSLATGRVRSVTDPRPASRWDLRPVWSPNGRWIAFERTSFRDQSDEPFIAVIHPDGSGLRLLTRGHGVSWSPDGKRIAFAKGRGIYVIPVTGGRPRLLRRVRTNTPNLLAPTWSPDGRAFVYVTHDGTRGTVWRMDSDGTHAKPIVSNRHLGAGLAWLPQ